MKAINSRSLPSYVWNRYKVNSGAGRVPIVSTYREYGDKEWSNGSGLEMYETFYRSYNAQNLSREAKRIGIGRFLQGDPMMEATVTMSGYVFSGNDPVMFTDLLGDRYQYMDRNGNKWHHADIFAGTALEGTPYTEGWGVDGFGNDTWGGGSGSGGDEGENSEIVNGGFSLSGETAQFAFKDIQEALNKTGENEYAVFNFIVNNTGIALNYYILNENYFSKSELTGYKDQILTFYQSFHPFLPSEGAGIPGGSYAIEGYAKIYHNELGSGKFIEWMMTVGVSGRANASALGKVNWYGSGQLFVGDRVNQNLVFKDWSINKEQINEPGWTYIGAITFKLPVTTQKVRAKIKVGYMFENAQGRAVAEPIIHYINILH